MTRGKLTINDIQKALLSNTHFIKEVEPEKPQVVEEVKQPENHSNGNHDIQIDHTTLKKFKILAAYQKVECSELINSALKHYLSLKSMQLEQAMLKLTEEQ